MAIIDYLQSVLSPGLRAETLRRVADDLVGVAFDTVAVRGVSGLLIGIPIADRLDKRLCVIRKPAEGTHSHHAVEGEPIGRYLILDDFVVSGETVKTIVETMREKFPSLACAGFYGYDCHNYHGTKKTLQPLGVALLNREPGESLATRIDAAAVDPTVVERIVNGDPTADKPQGVLAA
jgi:hypothetical protein